MRRRLSHGTAARGRERDDGLARQVIMLEECVDNMRCNIPPNREADKNCIVRRKIRQLARNLRAAVRIVHLNARAAFAVVPVKIILRIRSGGHNLIELGTDYICKFMRNFLRTARGRSGKEGNQGSPVHIIFSFRGIHEQIRGHQAGYPIQTGGSTGRSPQRH